MDILVIPALALALDACGGGGSQRPTPPPPPPPPPAATITVDAEASVDENADGGTIAAVATANANSVTVDDGRFEIADGNLKLKSDQSLDFEADTSPIAVVITASGDGESATATVSVSINDVNEAPSIEVADAAVDENAAGAILGAITLSDPDMGQTHTVTVSDDRFEAHQDSEGGWQLKLKDDASLDYETDSTVTVTVTVTDEGGLSASADATITVGDINEAPSAPVVRNADTLNVDEGAAGVIISSLENSADPEGDAITYHVNDERFEVDANQVLKLKDGMSLDYEEAASVELEVTAKDSAGNVSEAATVTLAVNDKNDAPSIEVADAAVDENAAGAILGAITLSDPDMGQTHTVAVSDDRFEARQDSEGGWQLKLKDDASLDYETDSTVTVTVTVTDDGGLSASAEATITVGDVNEAPSIEVADAAVDENAAGAILGAITLSDPDMGQTHTVAVSDDRFEARQDPEGGWHLKLKDDASLNYEDGAEVMVTVTVADDGGLSASTEATITVGDVNEAPSAPVVRNADMLNVGENAAGATVSALESSVDPEGDEAITYHVSDERFEVDANQVLRLKDGVSLDYEDAASVELEVTASDSAGNVSEATQVTLAVNDENEAPSIEVADAAVDENAAGAILGAITLSDPDMGQTHTVAVSDDRFEAHQDSESGWHLKLKDDASLNYEDGAEVMVTVTVTDDGGLSASAEATITVDDVNEAPSIEVADLAVDENVAGAVVGAITLSDPDMGQTHTVTVGDDRFEAHQDSEVGWQLKLKDDASLNYEDGAEVAVTVTVTDDAGLSASADATVMVGDVNEELSVTAADATVDENAAGAILGAITISDSDMGQTYTVTVSDERFEARQDSEGGWHLKLKDDASLDYETDSTVTVTVTATDNGNPPQSASAGATITVGDVNEAPSVEVADATVNENAAGAILGAITLSDPDMGQTHAVTVSDERFEAHQDSKGGWQLKLKDDASLNYEDGAEVTVTVTVTDDDGLSGAAEVTVTVENVDEAPSAPVVRNADMLNVDENAAGATVSALESSIDPEGDEQITYHVSDEHFEIDANQVLKLKDGMSLDHEEAASVELEVTASDSAGNVSEATTVTVAVNDVNEPPVVIARMPDFRLAPDLNDGILSRTLNLKDLFVDLDEGDQPVSYRTEGLPTWMIFTVTYGTDDDGVITITGHLQARSPDDDDSVYEAAIIATDAGGAEARAEFKVISDDGNDEITAVTLYTRDSNGQEQENLDYEVSVDENDASGVMLGRLEVTDVDNKLHPHGQHKIMVDDDRFEVRENEGSFELWLRRDESLDYEKEDGLVQVKVTVVDMNGVETKQYATTGVGTRFLGKSRDETIEVTVNDKNDAPVANKIGNWWVTVNSDLDEDDVSKGEWLSFYLAGLDDALSAFADEDSGDSLMYEIVRGPSWLEIDATTGKFTNKEDTMPERGIYDVTVRATDQGADRDDEDNADGRSATIRFKISVALSDVQGSDLNSDNDDPSVRITSEGTYTEGSGRRKVAAFTVTDDDQDIPDHPFAIKDVKIVKVENADNDGDGNNWMEGETEGKGYHAAFELELVENVGSAWTYNVYTTAKSAVLDHETVDDIKITVRVTDGVGGTDEAEIDIDIEDANEAPKAAPSGLGSQKAKAKEIEQSMDSKVKFYVNLHELFDDDDDDNDDNDLDFGVSVTSGASWIKVLHGPVEWSDIEDEDDVSWGGSSGEPAGDDIVVIFEVDRTGGNNGQGDTGAVKFTATDEDGATGQSTLSIKPKDEDLDIPDEVNAVRVTGNTREGSSLRVRFDENKDPDLAGDESAQLVFYQWAKVDGDDEILLRVTSSDTLVLTQAEVDHKMKVTVFYHELNTEGKISNLKVGGSFTTDAVVRNAPDRASAHFNFTTEGRALKAEVDIMDEDGVPDLVTYTWQVSENGRGGWEDVRGARNEDEVDVSLGRGYYYRVVVTYTDDHGGKERLESDSIRLGALRDPQTEPEIVGSPNPGGTLSVKNAPSTATVQWQMKIMDGKWVDISGAGDELDVKAEYAGEDIRALVTYMGGDADSEFKDDVIAVVPVTKTIGGDVSNSNPVEMDTYEIEVNAPASGTQKYEYVIPLGSLFQDPEGDSLTYTIEGESPLAGAGDDGPQTDDASSSFGLFNSDGGVMVVEVEGDNARLTYVTDVSGGHDGDDSDGGGNVLKLTVGASDNQVGNLAAETEITIRLNVAPTTIEATDREVYVEEDKVYRRNEKKLAVLDVQDENAEDHKFGQHTFTVSDSRFEIKQTTTGNPFNPTIELGLFVKSGTEFDYETEKEVKLTITATDGGGLTVKKPLTLTIEVVNDPADDAEAPNEGDVPGLKDDDGDDDDVTDDIPGGGDGDGDNDGGIPIPPPPDAGGFVDDSTNLNVMEEDLLDGFVLAIDDIDIA